MKPIYFVLRFQHEEDTNKPYFCWFPIESTELPAAMLFYGSCVRHGKGVYRSTGWSIQKQKPKNNGQWVDYESLSAFLQKEARHCSDESMITDCEQ